MQLAFEKKDDDKVEVFFKEDNQKVAFDYGELVLKLYNDKRMEPPEICGDFTEVEKQSIEQLVADINNAIEEANNPKEELELF